MQWKRGLMGLWTVTVESACISLKSEQGLYHPDKYSSGSYNSVRGHGKLWLDCTDEPSLSTYVPKKPFLHDMLIYASFIKLVISVYVSPPDLW